MATTTRILVSRLVSLGLVVAVNASEVWAETFTATTDLWIRESAPDTVYENDLISVWSSWGNDGARRYGVIDFDIGSLAGQQFESATLGLWGGPFGFSDDFKPIIQYALSIDTSKGTPTSNMTWFAYEDEYENNAEEFETLGRIDLEPIDAADFEEAITSDASAADLVLLQKAASSANGIVTFVLIADEDDEIDYAKSWGDGPDGLNGMDAELEIRLGGDPCDFDGDGSLGLGDVNLLLAEVAGEGNNASFDVNGDGNVDQTDINFFISDESKLHTWIGDANLDGEFNSSDFVKVFQDGLFETGIPADWSQGDWNGDGVFSSSDFVAAFQDGGFEQGPRIAANPVPEPASCAMLMFGLIGISIYRRLMK